MPAPPPPVPEEIAEIPDDPAAFEEGGETEDDRKRRGSRTQLRIPRSGSGSGTSV